MKMCKSREEEGLTFVEGDPLREIVSRDGTAQGSVLTQDKNQTIQKNCSMTD